MPSARSWSRSTDPRRRRSRRARALSAPMPRVRRVQTLSRARARRIALAAQGFADAPHASPTLRTLVRTVRRTGVLQVDSVNVLQRAHYMPLYSRMGPYDPDLLRRAAETRDGPQPRGVDALPVRGEHGAPDVHVRDEAEHERVRELARVRRGDVEVVVELARCQRGGGVVMDGVPCIRGQRHFLSRVGALPSSEDSCQ